MFDGLSPMTSPMKMLSVRYDVSVRCRWLVDCVVEEGVVLLLGDVLWLSVGGAGWSFSGLLVEGGEFRCVDGMECECVVTGASVSVSRRELVDMVVDGGVAVECV